MLVSVVIPVKNGGDTIKSCLEALYAQSVADKMEVIVIDSGSTDGTLDIIRQFPVRLVNIESRSFNHGLTRNEGAKLAKGEFVYFTVQDAVLADTEVLERMLRHFQDESVAGVCGNQGIPHDKEKNPVIWYKPIDAPTVSKIYFPDADAFYALSPVDMSIACAWDDVNAMYRHSILEKIPFVETDFAEDHYWAKQALVAGYAIIRDSGAVTWHYHHQYFKYTFKLHYTIHYHFYKLFALKPDYPAVLRPMAIAGRRLLTEKSVGYRQKAYWMAHNFLALAGKWYSVFVFRRQLAKKDEKVLNDSYRRYCGTVPQGRLKSATS